MVFGRRSWMWAGACALAAGCSTSSSSNKPATGPQVCPATVDDTVGKSCTQEGLTCSPEYACGAAVATLQCVCRAGQFVCSSGGGRVDAGDPLPCGSPVPAGQCPPSESTAAFAPCIEQGQVCVYPARCPGIPGYDECYCFSGIAKTGGIGLRYECLNSCSGTDAGAPPVDSGGLDARADAPVESGVDGDGAADDATHD
jgi:hypothetical protein